MRYASLKEEKKLWKKGYKFVAGLDEAGRGPLCGPVVAAVVVLNPKSEIRNPKQILNSKSKIQKRVSDFVLRASDLKLRDSKKLTKKMREFFYNVLTTHQDVLWGVGIVSEKIIDKINILEATKLAMVKAIEDLKNRLHHFSHDRRKSREVSFLILDGNMALNLPIPQKSIVRGDEKVFSCAAASIIAKVTRDRIMMKYHKKFPRYRFDLHKGYGTKMHYQLIKKYGPCQIHRKSFNLVRGRASNQLLNDF